MSHPLEMAFEIPSKTFVLGEYLAINGTASLIMTTEPSFIVKVIDDALYGYHQDSPAGQLRKELGHNSVGFSFLDPHDGRVGFGLSTAEYLSVLLYDLVAKKEFQNPAEVILDNLEEYVSQYQNCAGGDYKPSGADMVAQVCGGLCWYDGMNFNAEALSWPFPGYEMLVFHTGKKMETHEHLKDLKSINLQQLIPILLAGRTSLDQKNLKVFAESVNYYYDALNELGLSDSTVYDSVMSLRDSDLVLGAKGCGALGMDTVIVICEGSNIGKVKELANQQDFQFISSTQKLHQGLSLGRQM